MTPPRGVNKTVRSGRPWRPEDLWTEEEITLLLAACPADSQNYRASSPWVIEIADLLGRTPAAISFHLGNIFALKRAGHGLENVGGLTERVYEKYRGKEDQLQREASRLRKEYFPKIISPRLEKRTDEDEGRRLKEELLRKFPEARLPADTYVVYEYRGSLWLGVLVTLQTALLYPTETAALFRLARAILGPPNKETPAVEEVLDGRTVELAERQIHSLAPRFHTSDLDPADRVTLALRLQGLKSLKRWKPNASRLELYVGAEEEAERERIRTYFRIDPTRLCRTCLMMLLDVLDDALATGKI